MLKSLRTKILASMILLSLICTITFMGVSYFTLSNAVTNQMKSDGSNLVSIINREIGKQNLKDTEKIEIILREIKEQSNDNIKYISLTDTSSKIIASSDSVFKSSNKESIDTVSSASIQPDSVTSGNIQAGESKGYIFKTESGEKVYNVSTPFYEGGKTVGTISIGVSLNIMDRNVFSSIIEVTVISLIVFFIAIILGIIISNNITTPITNVIGKLEYFSKGDFTVEFENKTNDETRKLTDALNQSVYILKDMLKESKEGIIELGNISNTLKSTSEDIKKSSRGMSSSITEVATGIEEQDRNINSVGKAFGDFSVTLEEVKQKIQYASESSSNIESSADIGAEKLTELVKSIEEVRNSFVIAAGNIQRLSIDANKINEIMSVINNVAEQTNLLALNAAIESARAGEAGRGFSVVAEEIRKLAEKAMSSSNSIDDILISIVSSVKGVSDTSENISSKMDRQISIVDNTMVAFNNIQSELNKTIPQFRHISEAVNNVLTEKETIMSSVEELSAISEQISSSATGITASVQDHVSSMEQLSDLADKVDDMANRLNKSIDSFKV